jgi:hypothetical protein
MSEGPAHSSTPSRADAGQASFDKALEAHRAQRLDEAERLYGEALAANAGQVRARHNLGAILGFDPSTHPETGQGFEFHTRPFDPLADTPRFAPDAVVIRHVLEHLTDPAALLEKLAWGASQVDSRSGCSRKAPASTGCSQPTGWRTSSTNTSPISPPTASAP